VLTAPRTLLLIKTGYFIALRYKTPPTIMVARYTRMFL
jgi:hypothetical protein